MIKLILIAGGGEQYDISELVSDIKWGGRVTAPARNIIVSFKDHADIPISLLEGIRGVLYDGDAEIFRGLIMKRGKNHEDKGTVKAYDIGIYLSNNTGTFSYENKTATQIFLDCCKRLKLPVERADDTEYVIDSLTKSKTKYYDAVADALTTTYKHRQNRFYVLAQYDKLSLFRRSNKVFSWVLEPGTNLSNWNYDESIEKIITRIELVDKDGKSVASASKDQLEERIGVFRSSEKADENSSSQQLNELVNTMLNEKSRPVKSLKISIPSASSEIIAGTAVYVSIPELKLKKLFYVEEDSHTFKNGQHSLSLTLDMANDVSISAFGKELH